MWPLLMRIKFPKLGNLLQYLDSVILPKATYAAQAWAMDQTDILEQIQTHFLRKLLQIYPPRATNYFLRLETGRLHITYRILMSTIKFHHKIYNMKNTRLPNIMYNELTQCLPKTSFRPKGDWLSTYTNALNKFGSSVEDIQFMFERKDVASFNNLTKTIVDNLKSADLEQARASSSYGYYV